jgi:hypothetical protein
LIVVLAAAQGIRAGAEGVLNDFKKGNDTDLQALKKSLEAR